MEADFSQQDLAWFERLYEAVIDANRRMNLTRITGREEFFVKHILDSALPFVLVPELAGLPESLRAADLGSGAGFPGLVLARLRPGWRMVLIERTLKKAAYLDEAAKSLGLKNVRVVARNAREAGIAPCHLIAARAVGRLAAVTRTAAPLLHEKGLLVHFKGGALDADEIEEGKKAAASLRLEQGDPFLFTLPNGDGRSVVISRSSGRRRGATRRRTRATP